MTVRKSICSLLLATVLLGSTAPLVSAADVDSSSSTTVTSDASTTEPSSDVSSSSTDVSSSLSTDASSTSTDDSSTTTEPSSTLTDVSSSASDLSSSSSSSQEEEETKVDGSDSPEMILERAGILERIIGKDDQYRVLNTTADPYRKVVYLDIRFPDGSGNGSGVMIGPDTILTAAHNVYDSETKNWASRITAIPAKNDNNNPYGSYRVSKYYVFRGYRTTGGESNYDMAVLKLDRQVDSRVGSLKVSSTVHEGHRIQVPGYPGQTVAKRNKMYTMFGSVDEIDSEANLMAYTLDTEPGQSGGPVLNNRNEVVGTHIFGYLGFHQGQRIEFNAARKVAGDSLAMIDRAKRNQGATIDVIVYPETKTGETYRLYHPGIKRHLYTQNLDEAHILRSRGWSFEGLKFKTATTGTPVYRLYHSGTREHIYTTSTNERDVLSQRGWRYEGIAWYSAGKKPVYRLYHPGLKVHLYTTDENEKNTLMKREWKYEGVSFYTL